MIGGFRGLFALMNRSLQTEDRSIRSHIFRFLFLLLTYFMLMGVQRSSFFMSAPGLMVFTYVSYLNFGCITVAALSFFASAITEEKEDMTLGLLKMADVSSLSLLLGKSTPRLITALVMLTAQLPFTMLAVTLGGISLGQVTSAYCCLFAYLVLCAYMSLFYSVIFARSRTAGFLTGLTLFLYFFSPFFFMIFKSSLEYYNRWPTGSWLDVNVSGFFAWLTSTSAFTRIMVILRVGFSESAISTQVISNLTTAAGFLLASWLVFEPCTRNEKPASESRGLLYKRLGTGGKIFGAGRAWRNALMWKDFNFGAGGTTMLLLKVFFYTIVVGFMAWSVGRFDRNFSMKDFGQIAMSIGLFGLILEAGVQASRVFYTETKWKTLSSIVLLPKSIGNVGYSKVAGSALALLPAFGLFLLGVVCAPSVIEDFFENTLDEPGFWYFASQIILAIHLTALLSLYLKWGALPIAIAMTIGGNMMIGFFLTLLFIASGPSSDFGNGLLVLGTLLVFCLCIVIHFWIGSRLEHMAAS